MKAVPCVGLVFALPRGLRSISFFDLCFSLVRALPVVPTVFGSRQRIAVSSEEFLRRFDCRQHMGDAGTRNKYCLAFLVYLTPGLHSSMPLPPVSAGVWTAKVELLEVSA